MAEDIRTKIKAGVAIAMGMAVPTGVMADTYVYIAATKAGVIDSYQMDETTGVLTPVQQLPVDGMVAPMALHPDGHMLYAGIRSQPFRVLSLKIDPKTGQLTPVATAALPDNMAYISVDPSGASLFGASYGGGTIGVLPIAADGTITAGTRQFMTIGKNAHSILTDHAGRYVYATTLGSDEITTFQYDASTGALTKQPQPTQTPPGSGPRHLAFSPDGRSLYVLTELSGEVLRYDVTPETGALTERQRLSIILATAGLAPGLQPGQKAPDGDTPRIWAADIVVTPDGKQMFTSERTRSQITQIDIAQDGTLQVTAQYPTEQQPRDIGLDPSGQFLIATGEKSDHIAVFKRENGALTVVGRYPVAAGAAWVETVRVARN